MLKIHDLSFAYADKIIIQHLSYTCPEKGMLLLVRLLDGRFTPSAKQEVAK